MIFTSIFTAASPASAYAASTTGLVVDDLKIGNQDDGRIIDHFSVNQTVLLSARITNFQNSKSGYSIIYEIRNSAGITMFLDLKEGTIGENSMIRSISQWTPDRIDNYEFRSFVVDNLKTPEIISESRSAQIPIPKNATLITIFGCETHGPTPFCSRQSSSAGEVQLSGNWKKVYTDLTTSPELVKGKFGMALRLHAYSEDFVEISQISKANLIQDQQQKTLMPIYDQGEFSVSFWIKADPTDTAFGQVVSYLNTKKNRGWAFEVEDPLIPSIKFVVPNSEGKLFTTKGLPIPTDSFTNVIGTFDGSSIRLYSNGVLYDIVNFEGKYSQDRGSEAIKLGAAAYCFSCASWGGTLDELEVFNKSLTEQQVSAVASSPDGNPQSQFDDAIIGRWTFDTGLSDSSPNNMDGVLRTPVVSMAFSPDGTLFFTEKNTGKIKIMRNDKVLEPAFATISDVKKGIMFGLLGIAVDPHFSQNHYVYVFYTANDSVTGQDFSRVVRFTDVNDRGIDMTTILDRLPASNEFDSGGAITFDPQQRLYVSIGDGIPPYQEDESQRQLSQDSRSLYGKVLRVNRDGSVPDDNPFQGSPVFTLGHKNIFGIAFDPDGFGILTENGESLYDEINLIERGGNYGWPNLQLPNVDPQLSNSSAAIKPIRTYMRPIAPTQAVYYDGEEFPTLKGKFLFGSYNRGMLYALSIDQPSKKSVVSEELIRFSNPGTMPIISVAASPNGDIYVGAHDIFKLVSIDSSSEDARQVLSPVGVIMPPTITTDSMYYDSAKEAISFDINVTPDIGKGDRPNSQENNTFAAISIMIPSSFVHGVESISLSSISAFGGSKDSAIVSTPLHFEIEEFLHEIDPAKVDSSNNTNNLSWWLEENSLIIRIEDHLPVGKWRIEIDGSNK